MASAMVASSSLFGTPSFTRADGEVDRGLSWLARHTDRDAMTATVWFAPDPSRRFPLAALRAIVRARHQLDLGFDAGPEAFSAMVAARTLARRGWGAVHARALCRTFAENHWNLRFRFFHGGNGFAADTDCTSVALAALFESRQLGAAQLLEGARQLIDSGAAAGGPLRPDVVLVYWDDGREPDVGPRGLKQDPAVATNVLYAVLLAVEAGLSDPRLEHFLGANLAYVRDALADPMQVRTRYYPSRDTMLWFAAELCARFKVARAALGRALREAVLARLRAAGTSGDCLELAMRLGAATAMGISTPSLDVALAAHQRVTGEFGAGAFFTLGRLPGLCFGGEGLTTAIASASLSPGER